MNEGERSASGPGWTLINSDCVAALRGMADASIDAIVTDPPYELGFMGKKWDASGIAYSLDLWREALRVLKPGGHLLAFGGTRTYHRMACAIEDAGFEIRDSLHWVYGSGFPKSLDVSKAIDKGAGHWRGRASGVASENLAMGGPNYGRTDKGDPITPAARTWTGWGTALKPAHEPIVMARKPLVGTVAANVLARGTGAINVDGCRVRFASDDDKAAAAAAQRLCRDQNANRTAYGDFNNGPASLAPYLAKMDSGRWPPNLLLSDDAAEEMDRQSGELTSGTRSAGTYGLMGYMGADAARMPAVEGDTGGASRFFPVFRYVAKPARGERDEGCRTIRRRTAGEATERAEGSAGLKSPRAGAGRTSGAHNHHPTVKPVELMAWLVRLVTPPGGTVLDPFTGSGTTGVACMAEGVRFVGVEREAEYVEIARHRIEAAPRHQLQLFEGVA